VAIYFRHTDAHTYSHSYWHIYGNTNHDIYSNRYADPDTYTDANAHVNAD
jgi:hypothetical protein